MVFIRKKTNRYATKDGRIRTYTYGLLVRSHRPSPGASPVQQVIKYLGSDYDEEAALANAQTYIDEFEDLSRRTIAFAKKNQGCSAKDFYVGFVEGYLRHNGFKKKGGRMVLRDIIIDVKAFSVKKGEKKASVLVGTDLVNDAFLRDVSTRLQSMRQG